jgi:hypothetical protein
MNETEKTTFNFEAPTELYKLVAKEADRLGISIAGFMRMVAVNYFEKPQESKPEESNQAN